MKFPGREIETFCRKAASWPAVRLAATPTQANRLPHSPLLLVGLLFGAMPLHLTAQTTSVIRGTVQDAQGLVDEGTDRAVPILGERGGNAIFLVDGMPNSNAVELQSPPRQRQSGRIDF
jgi:hypothetical protein